MPRKTVIIGGAAAGLGSAGGIKAADPTAEVVVYTQFEDVAYSPCGIPYVHGDEIPDFERLFLASRQTYVDAGIDVRYESEVSAVDTAARTVTVLGERVRYDNLIFAAGFDYADPADPGVPGGHLGGLEMVTALAHRGVAHALAVHPGRARRCDRGTGVHRPGFRRRSGTKSHPATASSQPASLVRSAATTDSISDGGSGSGE